MSKSLFLTYDLLSRYQLKMDNLLMAKLLHDREIRIPNLSFEAEYREDSFFPIAISLLFGGVICIEDVESDGGAFTFCLSSPFIAEWFRVSQMYPEANMTEEIKEIFKPVQGLWSNFDDFCCYAEITRFGLRITLSGYFGFCSDFLEPFIECKEALERALNDKKTHLMEGENERNVNHFKRECGISPSHEAV